MKKIKCEFGWKEDPYIGYTLYGFDFNRCKQLYCIWYMSPVFMLIIWIKRKKKHLYHFLNDIGIMHTPPYHKMQFSDIWRK